MAKKARPGFWEARNGRYGPAAGRTPFLGEHPPDAPRPKKGKNGWNSPAEIDAALTRLIGGEAPRGDTTGGDTVVQVLDDFVSWCHENRSKLTADRYEEFIQDFVKATPEGGGIKFGALPVGRRLPGQAHLPGHRVEQDFGKPAAVVVASAEEQDDLFVALPHRSTTLSVCSFFR